MLSFRSKLLLPFFGTLFICCLFLLSGSEPSTVQVFRRSKAHSAAKNAVSSTNSTKNTTNNSSGNGSNATGDPFNTTTVNGTTWYTRVDFISGYYACGAKIQIGQYLDFEYLTGLAVMICNGSDWTQQALAVVVEAVTTSGDDAGEWQTLVHCPTDSYVSGESVLIEEVGPGEQSYIGLKMLCDDKNRTWIDTYPNASLKNGTWEENTWNAMAIEAIQLGFFDINGHVAINRIKNTLRPKNVSSLTLNYSIQDQDLTVTRTNLASIPVENSGESVMNISKTENFSQHSEESWNLENSTSFTIKFQTDFIFQVPELASNGTTVIQDSKSSQMSFGETFVEDEESSFEVSYQIPECSSGEIIEYNEETKLSLPFELRIDFNYGSNVEISGVYEKYILKSGIIEYSEVANNTCS